MSFKKTLIIGIGEADLDSDYWKRVKDVSGKTVFLPKGSPEIAKEIADAECVLAKFQTNIDKELLDKAPRLEYIGVLATAYGTIDVEHAKKKGIVVTNIPGYSTQSVAELVFGALLEHYRDLARGRRQVKEGNYSEAGFSARELRGKIFGILGVGRIGGRVAEIARGFGADVRYWSRNRKPEMEKGGVRYEDMDSLIAEADILSLHFAQTKETTNILDASRISKLKKGAVLVVAVPVETVDLKAIEERVRAGEITFITDHADEMRAEDVKRLVQYPHAHIYPPIAYISYEARMAKQEIFVSNVENFLKGKPQNTV